MVLIIEIVSCLLFVCKHVANKCYIFLSMRFRKFLTKCHLGSLILAPFDRPIYSLIFMKWERHTWLGWQYAIMCMLSATFTWVNPVQYKCGFKTLTSFIFHFPFTKSKRLSYPQETRMMFWYHTNCVLHKSHLKRFAVDKWPLTFDSRSSELLLFNLGHI